MVTVNRKPGLNPGKPVRDGMSNVTLILLLLASALYMICICVTVLEFLDLAVDSGSYAFQRIASTLSASNYSTYVSVPLASAIAGGLFGLGLQNMIDGARTWFRAGREFNFPPEWYIGFACVLASLVTATALPIVAHRLEENKDGYSIYAKIRHLLTDSQELSWADSRRLAMDVKTDLRENRQEVERKLARRRSRLWFQPTLAIVCSALTLSLYFLVGASDLPSLAVIFACAAGLAIIVGVRLWLFRLRQRMEHRELDRHDVRFAEAEEAAVRRLKRATMRFRSSALAPSQLRRIRRLMARDGL